MPSVNLYDIETAYGLKSIELHNDDITKLPFHLDAIVLSAYKNSYIPTVGTVIEALLKNCGVSVEKLASKPQLDLRYPLGVWLSGEISDQKFSRIICVEMSDGYKRESIIESSIKNVLSFIALADAQDVKLTTIALPILGAGRQYIDPEKVLEHLLPLSIKALEKQASLKKIVFVEKNEAKIKQLDLAMNHLLKRTKEEQLFLTNEQMTIALRDEILNSISRLKKTFTQSRELFESLDEIKSRLQEQNLRMFELSILSRRIAEQMVDDLLGAEKKSENLSNNIAALKSLNLAGWVISYLHILRIFGNTFAHHNNGINSFPDKANNKDIITLVFCLSRVLDIWFDFRTRREKSRNFQSGLDS